MGREKSRGPEVNVVNVVNVLPYTWKRKKVSYFTKGENVNNVNNVNHPQTGPKPDPDRTFWIIYMHFTQKERSDYYQLCS